LNEIEENLTENNIEQKEKVTTLTTLTTLKLIKSNENRKTFEDLQTKKEAERKYIDLKINMQELGLKFIEFKSYQGNHAEEIKEILERGSPVKEEEEKEKEQRTFKKLKFKEKRHMSGSSSSSSSSDNEDNDQLIETKRPIKSRRLITSITGTIELVFEFLKKALLQAKNGEEFVAVLEEKKYDFTQVHKNRSMIEKKEIFEVLKLTGCLRAPNGMQCLYCKVNYYEGDPVKIYKQMSEHMESTHLIRNKNQALNMLFNIYGNDWWMDFEDKHTTFDMNFHLKEIRYCKIANYQIITHKQDLSYGHIIDNHESFLIGKYSLICDLLKANLIPHQEVSLMKFTIRYNIMRAEEENVKI
jgi:hypothetical protein